ncbi:DUF3500 domain-containing protein [Maribacter sp. PR1]|uniref:DUF3500 domain-containing protein n=1 Tax=Maribacter cobaltidurans TaxID=1178778 RepID=A0ABU7IUQ2_9FLAO|nr:MULTISPECIES: DUF3500 domain-containing protein [Maribacter]MDC6389332.1 DUF3500 domain-containing protein [Maribacter sp. PR1]MEE1976720.1 DUF3500 domain-containing protein [Maribacter cobaltidurans]
MKKLRILMAMVLCITYCQTKAQTRDARTYFKQMEDKALAEKFQGITTSDGKIENLFPISATGISTKFITGAAKQFLSSLDQEQLGRTTYPIEDLEWRKWSNVDNGIYTRQGVSLKEMDQKQKNLAFDLMQESLSAKGLQLSRDIMKTDQTLAELNNRTDMFDEELYFFTVMGSPSQTEPWGWQLDGHHLVINYFVLGDQIVMSPVFMGGEPIITTTGKYAGNTLFQDEQNLGLSLMQSLSPEQQKEATLSKEKKHNSNKGEASKDNIVLDLEGLNVKNLSTNVKTALLFLIEQYISNMREGHHEIKMEEIKSYWDETWFAWIGNTTEDAVFYYRIHSPVILIEFDHQGVVGVPNVKDRGPTRNHIHTVVRTPNGNDYGKDLLKQHLETSH